MKAILADWPILYSMNIETRRQDGAKASKYSGQETRILSFKIEGEIAKALAEIISENGGSCEVTLVSAVNLTTAIYQQLGEHSPNLKNQ